MNKASVLVFNCGSSSIKFAVIEPKEGINIATGLVQRIGSPEASIKCTMGSETRSQELPDIDYRSALQVIIDLIHNFVAAKDGIFAVGHRVVHGGEKFTHSVIINKDVLSVIRDCVHLAPLHNPANIIGIEEAMKAFPDLPQIAVFDTAFHQTMPKYAYIYPVPYELYKENHVRRYGFHGTSHRFVCQQAATLLGKDLKKCAFVSAHLGNGCSAAAVLHGKSIDTTMGLTPLEGLTMGTRSGDVDPSLHSYLADNLGYDVHKVVDILNKKSGLLGISGCASDMRSIESEMQEGNARATLAFDVFCYRLAKYIGALIVPLGKIDALIFTGGIGENSPLVRAKTLGWLKVFGFDLDITRNDANGKSSGGIITTEQSKVAIVVPTNEELLIARDATDLAAK
ncbi:MAG: acetate kinase [Gammaproteobacteria bacterium]|nr:acetate kinase [Gammaproteobacteria bacterium]